DERADQEQAGALHPRPSPGRVRAPAEKARDLAKTNHRNRRDDHGGRRHIGKHDDRARKEHYVHIAAAAPTLRMGSGSFRKGWVGRGWTVGAEEWSCPPRPGFLRDRRR